MFFVLCSFFVLLLPLVSSNTFEYIENWIRRNCRHISTKLLNNEPFDGDPETAQEMIDDVTKEIDDKNIHKIRETDTERTRTVKEKGKTGVWIKKYYTRSNGRCSKRDGCIV